MDTPTRTELIRTESEVEGGESPCIQSQPSGWEKEEEFGRKRGRMKKGKHSFPRESRTNTLKPKEQINEAYLPSTFKSKGGTPQFQRISLTTKTIEPILEF